MTLRLARFRSNGFLLVVPVLIWNVVCWPLLPVGAGGSEPIPPILQGIEHTLRILVFAVPVFMTIDSCGRPGRVGWTIYLGGLVIYFASWLPWLKGMETESLALLLGPYTTPLAVFVGLATLCRSWPYAGVGFGFVAVHAGLGLIRAGIY